jgi:hypothetical protein
VPLSAHFALLRIQDNISTNYFSDHVQGGRSDEHPDFEPGWSSYTLKHEVENWLESTGRRLYIPQGAFVLAAIHNGLPMKKIPDDLGVFVG